MAKQNNSDWMSEHQDKELERIEKDISSLYSNAAKEVDAEFAKFVETSEKQLVAKQVQLQTGEITDTEYQIWVQKQMLQTDRYKATVNHMTDILVQSDKAAMAVVNGKLPSVIAESYNFSQALGFEAANKAGLSVGTFQVYNAKSVEKIIRDNPKLLKEVDVPEDKKWNQEHINREITTGLLKGESIPKVSERLQRVTTMDKNAATRNARTAMTAAENVGRNESAEELKAKGIPVEEVWSAAIDKRTRETHILLDGTVKDEDGFFGADILLHPLRYPADPDGDPEEVYNCRCRLNIQIKGIDHSNDRELYERFMKQNDPDSYKRIREVDEPKEEAYQKNKEKAEKSLPIRQERILQAREAEKTKISVQYTDLSKTPNVQTTEWFSKNSNYSEWKESVLDNEYDDSIYKYTGEYYSSINGYLRTGEFHAPNKWSDEETANRMIQEIDETISKFNLSEPITVYRSSTEDILGLGEGASLEEIKSKIGDVVNDKAYLSTSTLKELPDEQTAGGRILYEIGVPSGQGNGAYIQKYSENPQEREFLMMRDSRYEVLDVQEKDGRIVVRMKML